METTTPSNVRVIRPGSIDFGYQEAKAYLVDWCKQHVGWCAWMDSELDNCLIEALCRREESWTLNWESESFYNNPAKDNAMTWAIRYNFRMSSKASKTEGLDSKVLGNIRAIVTCWSDDTVAVQIWRI